MSETYEVITVPVTATKNIFKFQYKPKNRCCIGIAVTSGIEDGKPGEAKGIIRYGITFNNQKSQHFTQIVKQRLGHNKISTDQFHHFIQPLEPNSPISGYVQDLGLTSAMFADYNVRIVLKMLTDE